MMKCDINHYKIMIRLLVHHKIVRKCYHIILTSYFVLATTKLTENILYYCKMYYEEKVTLEYEWQIMFTVVKHLNVLKEVTTYHF